jgi:mRNA-degrading endonuclease RelE of RelBE toxin-antitoxin system
VKVTWTDKAKAAFRAFGRDREGWGAVLAATRALEQDPYPADGAHHGEYHRLHVGPYRVHYVIADEVITIVRVDRMPG